MSLAILAPPLSSRSGLATLRSRFAQSFLGVAALVLAMACGGGGGGGGGSTTPVVPPPVATSLTASDPNPAFGATFTLTPVYSAGTGTIDQGVTCPATGVASAAITANWPGPKTFTLTVTNSASVTATKTVVVTPKTVVVAEISPANPSVSVSTPITFTTSVTGGKDNTFKWSSSNDAGSWAGNVWTAPSTTGPVTITATSIDDPTKTATTTVTVNAAPVVTVGSISPANPTVTALGTKTFSATVTGGANNTVAWSSDAGTWAANVWTAPLTPGPVTITATADDDHSKIATTTVTVVAAATQPGVTAPANVTTLKTGLTASVASPQAGVTYNWLLSSGTITSATTGNSIVWTAPANGTVTITCTGTNAAGDAAAPGTHDSNVVPLPSITSFSASASRVALSGSTTLIANFTGGAGSVSGLGPIVGDGTPLSTNALTTTTVFTLTVTNAAGDAAVSQPTATVNVGNDLTVNITGLGSLAGSVDVAGPGLTQTLTADQTFNGLADGTYTITAHTITDPGQPGLGGALGSTNLQRYPTQRVQTVTLAAATTPTGSLTANYPPATLNVVAGTTSIDLVLVPGGTFDMGEGTDDLLHSGHFSVASPQHQVSIAKAFYVSKVPITQAQWSALVFGANPSQYQGPTLPVTNVSYDGITEASTGFLPALNTASSSTRPNGSTFRLPTDAEYEYATRAGSTTDFYFGSYDPGDGATADRAVIDTYLWSASNSGGVGGTIQPVGGLLPNAWGLYDMVGLIWQLCEDDWHADYTGAPINGSAWVDTPLRTTGRVYRGGSWSGQPGQAQSRFRGPYNHDDVAENNAGFRVVLQLP